MLTAVTDTIPAHVANQIEAHVVDDFAAWGGSGL